VGSHSDILTLTPSGGAAPSTIKLLGVATGPAVELNPTSLGFNCTIDKYPVCVTGGGISHPVTVTNVGETSLSITGIVVSGRYFSLTSSNCGSLGAGQSCTIEVRFAEDPWKPGIYTGELSVSYDGGTSVVSLTGSVNLGL